MEKTFITFMGLIGSVALLTATAVRADEKYTRPAEFKVTGTVVNENPGPYGASIGTGSINCWLNESYEPVSHRIKLMAAVNSPNRIIGDVLDPFDRLSDEFYKGAGVRVYRVINGQWTLVRQDTVKVCQLYRWREASPRGMDVKPTACSITTGVSPWTQEGRPYWFAVAAVDAKGRVSRPSNVAVWTAPQMSGDRPARSLPPAPPSSNETAFVRAPSPSPEERATQPRYAAIPAPTHFMIKEEGTNLFTCSWDPVDSKDLAAYRILFSYKDPAGLPEDPYLELAGTPANSQQEIRRGDQVFVDQKIYTYTRQQHLSPRLWYGGVNCTPPEAYGGVWPGEDAGQTYTIEKHDPSSLPPELAAEAGESCLKLEIKDFRKCRLSVANHSGTVRDYREALDPKKTFHYEFWAKEEGLTTSVLFRVEGPLSNEVPPQEIKVEGDWRKYSGQFRIKSLYDGNTIGSMTLTVQGPGTLWFDNFRVYETDRPFCDWTPEDYQALKAWNTGYLRTHDFIKTELGYSMDSFLNPAGVMERSGTAMPHVLTLPTILKVMKKAAVNPWLQIEMCMDEGEWKGFVEFMAAPYDPAKDTPQSKPWAYKRFKQGQVRPWLDEFPKVLIEISNETWARGFWPYCFKQQEMNDGATGAHYVDGDLYGFMQEYIIRQMKSSPYWTPELDRKFEFVLNAWATQDRVDCYGCKAIQRSPGSKHVTIAGYNGGWDEGVPLENIDDQTMQQVLVHNLTVAEPKCREYNSFRDELVGKGLVKPYELGTYEAGPGYSLPNTVDPKAVELSNLLMKSRGAGVATLDAFLMRGQYGWKLQNFFTFSRKRNYWTSHAKLLHGGFAYPSWLALGLQNREGQGDFLKVETLSVPAYDIADLKDGNGRILRKGRPEAPMVGCYAIRQGNRYAVYAISRKHPRYPFADQEGYSPVTINLPFSRAKSLTLYKLAGDPLDNNLDAEKVRIETVPLDPGRVGNQLMVNAITGADPRGLPPASAFLYVFEGTE